MVVTMVGALIITYASGKNVLLALMLAIFGESLFNALGLVSSKVALQRGVPNRALIFYRALIVFTLVTISALVSGKLQAPTLEGVGLSVGAAVAGPLLAFLCINHALSLIEASKMAIIHNIQPIVTVLLSLVIPAMMPTPRQFLGGAMSLIGVIVILQAQTRSRQTAAKTTSSQVESL